MSSAPVGAPERIRDEQVRHSPPHPPARLMATLAGIAGQLATHPADGVPRSFVRMTAAGLLLGVVLAAAVVAGLEAYSRPLWHDEIYTAIITDLPAAGDINRALNDAVDANPPLYYFLARGARRLIPDDHVAYRLPAIVGFVLTIVCLYLVLARRVDALSALTGASLVLALPVVGAFAFEARPYAPMLACASLAALAWQRLDDRPAWAVLLWVSLAAAVSLHYYAVLVWPAFALAEAVVSYQRRTLRVRVWAALAAGAVPLLLFREHLRVIREYYGTNLWSPPEVRQLINNPDWLLSIRYAGFIVLLAVSSWLLVQVFRAKHHGRWPQRELDTRAIAGEVALMLGFLSMPMLALIAALTLGGDLTARYTSPVVIGVSLGAGLALSTAAPALRWFVLLSVLGGFAAQNVDLVVDSLTGRLREVRTAATRSVEEVVWKHQASAGMPVVVSDALQYLPLTRYGSAGLQRVLYSLVDAPAAVRYVRSDSVDRNLQALRPYVSLRIVDYGNFRPADGRFLLISSGAQWDWWPARLANDGHRILLLGEQDGFRIYRVELQ